MISRASNDSVQEREGEAPVTATLLKHRLNWYGAAVRGSEGDALFQKLSPKFQNCVNRAAGRVTPPRRTAALQCNLGGVAEKLALDVRYRPA